MADENTPQVTPETKATEEKVQVATKAESTSSAANAKSGLGIASLVLGIVGIVGSWIPILNNISFIIAILGVIFGAVGIRSVLKGTKTGKGITIAGLVISILACVIVFSTNSMYSKAFNSSASSSSNGGSPSQSQSQNNSDAPSKFDLSSGKATDYILANDLDVVIPEYTIETKSYSSSGKLSIVATNKTNDTKTFHVEMEAVDASGNRVSEYNANLYFSNLAPGQSQTKDVFQSFRDEEANKYLGATFKIIEVSER